jgi:hypothetical protein
MHVFPLFLEWKFAFLSFAQLLIMVFNAVAVSYRWFQPIKFSRKRKVIMCGISKLFLCVFIENEICERANRLSIIVDLFGSHLLAIQSLFSFKILHIG